MKHLLGTKIKTYRNLNNGLWSVKTTRVDGYLASLVMLNVTFTGAHSKAQEKIQNGDYRNVHAYAVGMLTLIDLEQVVTVETLILQGYKEVTYRPKVRSGFFEVLTGKEVIASQTCVFLGTKMFCLGVTHN